MVYTGKPSRGCQTCRARRIKCDEAKPTCNQCAKSRRPCAGYRPEFEIIHRDETKATQARVRKQLARAAAAQAASAGIDRDHGGGGSSSYNRRGSGSPSSPDGSGSDDAASRTLVSPTGTDITVPSPGSVVGQIIGAVGGMGGRKGRSNAWHMSAARSLMGRMPKIPLEQQAANYFAANFILVPRIGGTAVGYMEYLLPMLESEGQDSALRHAFNACAAAALGNRRNANRKDCASLALREESLALQKTFESLKDPATFRSDGTLAAVLLLILYESISTQREVGLLAWRSHVEGAVKIVTARGRNQLKTKVGRGLFNAVRMQLIARTLSSGIAPPLGADWWNDENTLDPTSAACQRFSLKTSEMRAEASRLMAVLPRNAVGTELMIEMLRRIQALDQDLASWMRMLPDDHWYKTSYIEQQPMDFGLNDVETLYGTMPVFPGRVDSYPSFLVSAIWNTARVSRLILASLVIRVAAWVCAPVDYRTTSEYTTARRICETTIADIVASVPYHLGWSGPGSGFDDSIAGFACGRNGGDDDDVDDTPIKVLPALFVIWPLTCMNSHDCSSPEQRAWAAGRLRYIGEELGIKYARYLADHRVPFPSSLIRRDGYMLTPDPLTTKTNLVISTKVEA